MQSFSTLSFFPKLGAIGTVMGREMQIAQTRITKVISGAFWEFGEFLDVRTYVK